MKTEIKTEIKIESTTEANPLAAQKILRRKIAAALNNGRSQHYTPEWIEPLIATEGAEQCGYGRLHITGVVEHWNGYATLRYTIDSTGSCWENYGHPSGTRYQIAITLRS